MKSKLTHDPGEVIAVVRRVLSENAREYVMQYVIAIICLLGVAGSTAFTAWIIKDVVDEIFYRQRKDLILVICGAILVAFILRGLATYGQAVLLAKIGNNLVARYQRRIYDHLLRLGVDFFNDSRSGQLAAQINLNVNGVRDLLNLTITSISRDAVALAGLIGVMVFQDPQLSLIALMIGPPLVLAVYYLMKRLRSVTREAVHINSRLVGAMQETTQGISIVKAFTMEDQLKAKLATLILDAESRANKIARVSERSTPIAEILAGFAVAGVIAFAGYRAVDTGQPPGSMAAFITALLFAYDPARRLAKLQIHLERSLVNARMIYEILDLEPKQGDVSGAGALKVGAGEVVFDNVSFSYIADLPVLHNVSFTAKSGSSTAIVGGSGAGKSTLVALLQRFYDLDSGAIRIDRQDISACTKASLRRSIAYVSQHPYLFEGSIRDNIRYGRPDASDAEIEEAARLAYADEFIRQQSDGYDTPVGENGVTLSGGQRQRISIARAIVRNAPILLLDEATSALDNDSELQVQKALETIMQDRTTIVIAHRLSTIIDADHIIVLEDGYLAEQGRHDELIKKRNGVYARFHRLQGARNLEIVDDTGDKLVAQE